MQQDGYHDNEKNAEDPSEGWATFIEHKVQNCQYPSYNHQNLYDA